MDVRLGPAPGLYVRAGIANHSEEQAICFARVSFSHWQRRHSTPPACKQTNRGSPLRHYRQEGLQAYYTEVGAGLQAAASSRRAVVSWGAEPLRRQRTTRPPRPVPKRRTHPPWSGLVAVRGSSCAPATVTDPSQTLRADMFPVDKTPPGRCPGRLGPPGRARTLLRFCVGC